MTEKRELTPRERMAYQLGFDNRLAYPVRHRQGVRRTVRVTEDEVTVIEEIVIEEQW
ncbi:hypothetical protein RAJCM14343_3939 [Rhodococcus aetherivorans]|uniref:DUF4224 domain-containing protein n=1 Tax=Rhodococcus aetherivorans TaxID=191292 RepID=A0ABQ0YPZ4_9NOCA|nr:hypothetical protein [Rhodococcus aetherivorans]ETT25280.1 hypothetical protein RR21198_4020 [Rhodococcus rhodochrous ATCC 21198]NGP28447.1 hypothetical protein [Rhodococcus aetherivorans]GES38674.1 hypothetical protein RAJCM14343_3939 [Rhodococcus aetherivorans]